MTKRPALVLFALCILLSAARPPVSAAAFRVPTRSAEPGATSQEVLSAPVYVPADSTRAAQPLLTRFTRGTVSRGAAFDQVINLVLDQYAAAIPELPWYAVTDITSAGEASLVSVVGLATTELASGWSIEQGGWFGLLLIAPAPAGGWLGALSGTPAFTALLDEIPDSIMSAETRTNLDPRRRSEQSNGYIFPWEPGTAMEYVSGVHQNGFADYTPGWLAVDFISTYDPESGMAPSAVYAAAAGTIDWKCSPYWGQTSAAIRIGELMYVHLVNTPDLATGRSLAQGEVIGYMQPGEFNENCGVARQGSGQYHLHLGFPATRTLTLEG
ncbi:MAG: hypothetical protein LLG44_05260, partial [Chloroflexi bacterium]|nr:hypothetical protein [Chloroflexota bacterium]